MQHRETEALDRRIKWWLLGTSLLALLALGVAALRENALADWRLIRHEYAGILRDRATDEHGATIAKQFEVRLVQNVLPELARIDRCITCHAGVDDPRMIDQPQPFATHPGRYLQIHGPAKFGCTICHQGQGRATEIADAHGRVPHWDYPLLEKQLLQTTCTRCHAEADLYSGDGGEAATRGAALIIRGRQLTRERGCLGCHALDGKGGTLSLDISSVGDKTRHGFDFSHLDRREPRQVEHWLKEHFLDPARVSPGTSMPDIGLSEEEAEALTAYMRSLRRKVVSAGYRPPARAAETGPDSPSGAQSYAMYCSSCHGRDGRVSEVPAIQTPALNNVDALAVASDEYLRFIIADGRSGTGMPAWGGQGGNLTRAEIDRIVAHLRSWEPRGARVSDVNRRSGDPRNGRAFYQGMCAGCHGQRGEGGIGSSLNSPTFLAVVSDPFMAETIIHGRPGTAMPSWKHLSARAVSDILAYVRTWHSVAPPFDEVRAGMQSPAPRASAGIGRTLYRANCAVCHGREGEGGAGPRLRSLDLLLAVDDFYLYRAITAGRPSTAMPAWSHLSAEDLAAVISHMRTWQQGPPLELRPLAPPGNYLLGETHYELSCQGCHGEGGRGGVGPQLANPVFLGSASDAALFHWIGRGREGTAMRGFLSEEEGPTRLTPHQIADVIAYLRHLGARANRPVLRTAVGDPVRGGELFAGNCVSCHGTEGEGASGPQLNNPTFLRSASDGFLYATLVLGRSGTPMRSMAVGHEGAGQIHPDQIQDVIAHVRQWDFPRTWRKPRVTVQLSEPALDSGRELYAHYCAGCHGPTGRGTRDGSAHFAPALNNPEFLGAVSDGFLVATIVRGRSGTPMRPFGRGAGGIAPLGLHQITDIVSFLRSWQDPLH